MTLVWCSRSKAEWLLSTQVCGLGCQAVGKEGGMSQSLPPSFVKPFCYSGSCCTVRGRTWASLCRTLGKSLHRLSWRGDGDAKQKPKEECTVGPGLSLSSKSVRMQGRHSLGSLRPVNEDRHKVCHCFCCFQYPERYHSSLCLVRPSSRRPWWPGKFTCMALLLSLLNFYNPHSISMSFILIFQAILIEVWMITRLY